jgi:hypothetical protein
MAYVNWSQYADWQRRPANALVRQPAVELRDFPAWQALQMAYAAENRPAFTVDQWQRLRRELRLP